MSNQGRIDRYTDQGYATELLEIRERLLLMAGRVEHMIGEAIASIVNRDTERAELGVDLDRQVNQDELDLDALCLELLACRQPMASDLRFVVFTLKMVTDLERIADLAVNIMERAKDLNRKPALTEYIIIPRMGDLVREMVRNAIDAFIQKDIDLAFAVIEKDDEVDDLYRDLFRQVLNVMREDSKHVHRGIHVQSVAKFLERIGDHSTNLAEQAIFMIGGDDVRHEGKLGDIRSKGNPGDTEEITL